MGGGPGGGGDVNRSAICLAVACACESVTFEWAQRGASADFAGHRGLVFFGAKGIASPVLGGFVGFSSCLAMEMLSFDIQ